MTEPLDLDALELEFWEGFHHQWGNAARQTPLYEKPGWIALQAVAKTIIAHLREARQANASLQGIVQQVQTVVASLAKAEAEVARLTEELDALRAALLAIRPRLGGHMTYADATAFAVMIDTALARTDAKEPA